VLYSLQSTATMYVITRSIIVFAMLALSGDAIATMISVTIDGVHTN